MRGGSAAGARGLDPWEVTRLEATGKPTIEVTATPCRHGPPLSRPIVGDVIGFALRWDGQRNGVVWVSGDTVLYNGVRKVADRLDVDVAILHLGEVQFPITGPVRYSMTARDAVELCRALRPRVAIPVHYEGWSHFHEGRDAIERELTRAPSELRDVFRLIPLGEPIEVVNSPRHRARRRPSCQHPGRPDPPPATTSTADHPVVGDLAEAEEVVQEKCSNRFGAGTNRRQATLEPRDNGVHDREVEIGTPAP